MKRILFLLFVLAGNMSANAQEWVLVWADEFNTPGLPDTSKWSNEVGYIRNNELQYYANRRIQNTHIDDTALIIEAIKDDYMGSYCSSASLISRYRGDWLYGRIEVRAKIPTGKGAWPAIWMMPSENKYGGWPYSGEIDIMENVGYEPDKIYSTLHYSGTDGSGHQQSGSHAVRTAPYDTFYTYSIEWTPDKIDWYIDDTKVYTYDRPLNADYRLWPFNERFYLILNLAVGGTWGGAQGVDASIFPLKYHIDFVRVYTWQTDAGPYTVTSGPVTGGTLEISPQQATYTTADTVELTAIPDPGYYFDGFLYMGKSNPLRIVMNENKTVIPLFFKNGELIKNGTFDRGITGWNNIYIFDPANQAAKGSWEDSAYVFNITKPASEWWHMGDQWLGIPAINGKTYKVSFDAWAEHPAMIGLNFARNHPDYEPYYENSSIYVSTIKAGLTWQFTFDAPTDNNCRLYFGMGRFTGKVYLDNISLTELNPTSVEHYLKEDIHNIRVISDNVTGRISVAVNAEVIGNTHISIVNMNGVELFSMPNKQLTGSNHLLHPDVTLSAGVYILQFRDNKGITNTKFIIHP